LISFFQFISIILFNALLGYSLIFIIKAFLFLPKNEKHFRGKRIPLTPAYVYRKKNWLIKKLNNLLNEYLEAAKDEQNRNTRIATWENTVFNKISNKLRPIDKWFLPAFIKEKIKHYLALLCFEIVRQFFRDFIPYLLEKYKAKSYIEKLSDFIDIDLIVEYYDKYIHKWLTIFNLIVFSIYGLFNSIFFLIIK